MSPMSFQQPAVVAMLATLAMTSHSAAQSINIDFGPAGSAPPSDYAAAGLPGAWNALDQIGPDAALLSLDGQPLAATLASFTTIPAVTIDDPGTTGNEELLLDDAIIGLGDVVIETHLNDLLNGTYDIIVYAWVPDSDWQGSLIWLDDEFGSSANIGGVWPGSLTEGITHGTLSTTIHDHSLSVFMVSWIWGGSGALNGIQLVRTGPLPADLDDDGLVGPADLAALLAAWGPCPKKQPCPADIDDDGQVGPADLAALLAVWG